MKISLRRPNSLTDIEELMRVKNNKIAASFLGSETSNDYSARDISNWIQFHDSKKNNDIYVIVEDSSGHVIGHVGLYDIDRKIAVAEFGILIGNPDYFGKGIGRLAMNEIIQIAKNEHGLSSLQLKVLTMNKRAIVLYLKFGFEIIELRKKNILKDSNYYDELVMLLDIDKVVNNA